MRATILLFLLIIAVQAATLPRAAEELRFCLHGAPKTLDPFLATDTPSETIRFLTAGMLARLDRASQKMTPEIAASWAVAPDHRQIDFTLRPGVRFSDGSLVGASDVVFTMRKMLDPALHSPIADSFRFGAGEIEVRLRGTNAVSIRFPKPVAQIVNIFDGVPVTSEHTPGVVAGPYMIASYKAGSEILLRRNPYYWKKDEHGTQLPYIAALRIRVQSNREMEYLDFERGEVELIPELSPDLVERLTARNRAALVDLGMTLDSLVMWFNQVPTSTLPPHKKVWFQSDDFRKAVSMALNRTDICRIGFLGKAQPGIGPISPANRQWFNQAMKAETFDPSLSLKKLRSAGFIFKDGSLSDPHGNPVAFSVMTNAGSKVNERVLGLMQQDLRKIGVKLTVTTLDFPSLIERIAHTFNYEACMLNLTNVGLDPEEQINVWMSTGANHQWNPNQKRPATPWEKEVDDQMTRLASGIDQQDRKKAFDRVQALISEHAPFLYLVHPKAQAAVSHSLKLAGAPLWPYMLSGLERASFR